MRIARIEIDRWRVLKGTSLPLDGLVVLYGANSSGKTTILEAVSSMLAGARPRIDPYVNDPGVGDAKGRIFFELDCADLPGHPDADLYLRLVSRRGIGLDLAGHFGPDLALLLEGADAETVCSTLEEAYVEQSQAGAREDRELVAAHAFRSRLFMFEFETLTVWLVAPPPEDAITRDAVERVAVEDHGDRDDYLLDVACDFAKGDFSWIRDLTRIVTPEEFFEDLVVCMSLNLEHESLANELREGIEVVHDRLWRVAWLSDVGRESLQAFWPDIARLRAEGHGLGGFGPEPEDLTEVPVGYIERDDGSVVRDRFLLAPGRTYEDGYGHRPDAWLEVPPNTSEGPNGSPGSGETNGNDSWDGFPTWQRVRPSIACVARLISDAATRLAPSFVQDQGRIEVEILPPWLWAEEPSRVRIALVETTGERFDIRVLGSGVARWLAASLRLASHDLAHGVQRVLDPLTGVPITDASRARDVALAARRSPMSPDGLCLVPGSQLRVVLVDEPESHLHPAAVTSVGDWLAGVSERGAVVAATHHSSLLNSNSLLTHVALVRRDDDGTSTVRMVDADLISALDGMKEQIGLSAADLFLLTRLVLFVEGPHDVAILGAMFGDRLRRAGVQVIPIHGVGNLPGLVDSEVVQALGLPMALVTDRTNSGRVRRGEPQTDEERAVSRFIGELARKGTRIESLGHSKPDILDHLDEGICRKVAPKFPGWDSAAAEWKRSGRTLSFKSWGGGVIRSSPRSWVGRGARPGLYQGRPYSPGPGAADSSRRSTRRDRSGPKSLNLT
jgi:energy-coupling factor transporter ATP-binding protein EcfA2